MLSLAERMIAHADQLTETEEQIGDYLLAHESALSTLTIAGVAKQVAVAPNTITRLCKKLGYRGFVELKMATAPAFSPSRQYTTTFQAQETLFANTIALIDADKERQIISLMRRVHQVLFFAKGETSNVARYFSYAFNAVNKKTILCQYPEQIQDSLLVQPDALVFLLSYSGQSDTVLTAAKLVKTAGAKLVSLTAIHHDNPLAGLADVSLYCYSPTVDWKGFDLTNKFPMFVTLNALLDHTLLEFALATPKPRRN